MASRFAAACAAVLAVPVAAQQAPIFPGRAFPYGQASFVTSQAPDAVIGDLSGDAIPDLVVLESSSQAIWRLLGTGNGAFGTSASFPVGQYPNAVAIEDMDGDGRADVVVAQYKEVLVVHGDGVGGFSSSTTFPFVLWTNDLDLGDLNADGRPDVAVASGGGEYVEVRLGLAAGGLGPSKLYVVANNPEAIVTADVDIDGDLDIATAEVGNVAIPGTTVTILMNSGAGLFSPDAAYFAGDRPFRIATGDLDADGSVDLVTGNQGYPELSILFGDGSGAFSAPFPHKVSDVQDVAIGDANGDGNPDVVWASNSIIGVGALLGDGMGGVADITAYPAGGWTSAIDLEDLDGDGGADLVATSSRRATVLLSRPSGGLGASSYYDMGGTTAGLGSADFDGDGRPDLAVAMASPSPSLVVMTDATPAGIGSPSVHPVPSTPGDLAVGDWNGDGNADVATADAGSVLLAPGSTVSIRFGDGLGTFPTGATHPVGLVPNVLRSGDLNGDGVADLIAQNAYALFGTGDVWLLLSNGTGALSVQHAGALLGTIRSLGDANDDGLLDVVATTYQADFVCILAGLPGGGFASGVCHPAGPAPKSALLADANGDGTNDLVVGNDPAYAPTGPAISVLPGLGGGAFGAPQAQPCVDSPAAIAVADVDANGTLDVLATHWTGFGSLSASMEVLLGNGAGGLGPPTEHALVWDSIDPVVVDFDLDGRPDVAMVTNDTGGSAVSILWNQLGTPAGIAPFGAGTPGCAGAQVVLANTIPKPNTPGFGLTVSNAPPDAGGWLLVGTSADIAGSDPLGIGLSIHVDPTGGPLAVLQIESDAGGSAFAPLPIPNDPAAVGTTLHAQAVWPWPPASPCDPSPLLLSSSRGVSVTVQP